MLSYKLRHIVGFGLVEMAISTNPKPTIYRCRRIWDQAGSNKLAKRRAQSGRSGKIICLFILEEDGLEGETGTLYQTSAVTGPALGERVAMLAVQQRNVLVQRWGNVLELWPNVASGWPNVDLTYCVS